MAEYDPVPPEYLLDSRHAQLFVPDRFVGTGEAIPRELALHVLVDDSRTSLPELKMFQQAGNGNIARFFGFMKSTLDNGGGRHTQHMLAAVCLYPDREAMIDLAAAGAFYLDSRGSLAADLLSNRILLGSIALCAMTEYEANLERVLTGRLHIP